MPAATITSALSRSHLATSSAISATSRISEFEKSQDINIKRNHLMLAAIEEKQRQEMVNKGLDPVAMEIPAVKVMKKLVVKVGGKKKAAKVVMDQSMCQRSFHHQNKGGGGEGESGTGVVLGVDSDVLAEW